LLLFFVILHLTFIFNISLNIIKFLVSFLRHFLFESSFLLTNLKIYYSLPSFDHQPIHLKSSLNRGRKFKVYISKTFEMFLKWVVYKTDVYNVPTFLQCLAQFILC